LLYNASFKTAILTAGTAYRVETLVTFGNAGLRGGSGATADNIDINGNGTVDQDEAHVRTVPCRITLPPLPAAPDECNDSVTVKDSGATTTGTVSTSNPIGFDQFPATTSTTKSWTVSVDVDGGVSGGAVCNEAVLDGVAWRWVQLLHIYQGWIRWPWRARTALRRQLLTVFAAGLTIGINDGAGPKHNVTWQATLSGRSTLKTYLTSAAGGATTALTADTVNATSTSGEELPRQTAALTLNVGFSDAGLTGSTGFGNLKVCNLAAGSTIGSWTLTAAQALALNGKSISEVLTDAIDLSAWRS
jgi:hypothetical protein